MQWPARDARRARAAAAVRGRLLRAADDKIAANELGPKSGSYSSLLQRCMTARAMRDAHARPLPSGGGCCELPTTEPPPVSLVSSKLLLLTATVHDRAQLMRGRARYARPRARCATRGRRARAAAAFEERLLRAADDRATACELSE